MSRLLMAAFAAVPLLASACASSGSVEDELAGETSEDAALDGKGDAASSGVYTYFEVWKDLNKCLGPTCGGYYLRRLNRSNTVCHNNSTKWACYVPELDWSEADLSDDLKAAFEAKAVEGASSWGAIALVRGRFGAKTYGGSGNLGRFIVTEAWAAENDSVSEGVFVKAYDNGIRCITTPCPTVTEKALNTSRAANIGGIDWAYGGFDDDQVSKLVDAMTTGDSGVIFAGDRYNFKENGQWVKGRTASAAYRRLQAPAGCFVGGCSGQVCSDQEGVVSTCEWRAEYACYQTATCERQADGECGWTETPELTACLANP